MKLNEIPYGRGDGPPEIGKEKDRVKGVVRQRGGREKERDGDPREARIHVLPLSSSI